jgi:predicted Ser/Thr protein kinase
MLQFFVRYLDSIPIIVNTHINEHRTRREFPLENAADLIRAYKDSVVPLLDDSSITNLTLHLPASTSRSESDLQDSSFLSQDSVSTSFHPTLPLCSLGGLGSIYKHPLLIKSLSDSITMNEYLAYTLPPPVYIGSASRPNSSGNNSIMPANVTRWAEFESSVNTWIQSQTSQHSHRVKRPFFVPRLISEEVPTLQPFIMDNMLTVASKCFIPPSDFVSRRVAMDCVAEPDFVMTRDGEIVAIVEVEGNRTLSSGDIFEGDHHSHAASALNQLYKYLRLNHRQYGILTTYDCTWFVCRDPNDNIHVSAGIAYNCQSPTILQCLAYFNSLVNSTYIPSPPTSNRSSRTSSASVSEIPLPRRSPRLSRAYRDEDGSSPILSRASSGRTRGSSSNELSVSETQYFNVDDFKFSTVLGEGRTKVYLDEFKSQSIALKVADVAKHHALLPELLNEVSIYEKLSALQGTRIPKFVCHGFIEGILYAVCVSPCGNIPVRLDDKQKSTLLNTLELIHQTGILHNDLKKENLLVDEYGNPFIIDFGYATLCLSEEEHKKEWKYFSDMLDSFTI